MDEKKIEYEEISSEIEKLKEDENTKVENTGIGLIFFNFRVSSSWWIIYNYFVVYTNVFGRKQCNSEIGFVEKVIQDRHQCPTDRGGYRNLTDDKFDSCTDDLKYKIDICQAKRRNDIAYVSAVQKIISYIAWMIFCALLLIIFIIQNKGLKKIGSLLKRKSKVINS